MERPSAFVADLLVSLKDDDPTIVKQSIVRGTCLFFSALEDIALQILKSGEVDKYLQERWVGLSEFKAAVFHIFMEPGSVGIRLVAMKFIEAFILLFTPDVNGSEVPVPLQTYEGKPQKFNVTWFHTEHPVLNVAVLKEEADKQLNILLHQLQSPSRLGGSAIIALVNCLAAIARRRPLYYNHILSALFNFNPMTESDGNHVASIQYSLRTAFLSFLKGTDVTLIASRERLVGVLRGMNAGEAAEQVLRHIEKMTKNNERSLGDNRYAKIHADNDVILMVQKHVVADYQHQKGHELSMHVLYHLHGASLSVSEGNNLYMTAYEEFLLSVAKTLRDSLPATDKSLSRLLGEAPVLPNSVLRLLEELCHPDPIELKGDETYNVEVERITQGLGALWSLILGRPLVRRPCLEIVLKCAIHVQDDIRAKAVRLVANKLYHLDYISEEIEQFATSSFLSVVDGEMPLKAECKEQRTLANCESFETSTGGSQNSEPGSTHSDSIKNDKKFMDNLHVSSSQAQRQMSLYFALCTKKPLLLQLVFSIYGRAQKAVKQVIHRHIPILVRSTGSSFLELLSVISEPPQRSENLLVMVLQTLTAESTPTPDLIATVKQLYETKLKDAAILIPILSLLSKEEVLPIFPKLVDLPLDKFKAALDHILQGSAHTGPALTPVEVLVAIHGVDPEKDGIALKKITDACTACFVQRTVFTQQVLAKALNVLVEQTPLPLLFMRTVIQAIDAFPTLVDFVMGILLRLVSKQIWQMPKLWVGFLKCTAQTQPHSFNVLLQLPPPQLESALNRHPPLRVPLATYANQSNIRTSLPRSTLAVLGLLDEKSAPMLGRATSQLSETCSSVQSTTPS